MEQEDVQRIAVFYLSFHVQNISCRTHIRHWSNMYRIGFYQPEREGRIEQCHVDTTSIVRSRHYIFVAGLAKKRTAGKVKEHTVVLHFAQAHDVRQMPAAAVLATGNDGLPRSVQLLPVLGTCPMARGIGQELIVILQCIVPSIKQVLRIQFYDGQTALGCRRHGEQREDED